MFPRSQWIALSLAFGLCAWSISHAEIKVVGTETIRTTDAQGNVIEKRITKKIRTRTVIDFEEANIEGKVKKPNAAYLMHGASLQFKHLYRLKQNQRSRMLSIYEYVR